MAKICLTAPGLLHAVGTLGVTVKLYLTRIMLKTRSFECRSQRQTVVSRSYVRRLTEMLRTRTIAVRGFMMTRFRRLTEFTFELSRWARVLGNEALVAVREIRWTRKKKLLATGIGCCGLLVSVATWNAFQGLEDGFENSQPSMLPADQVSPLTDIDESATDHAPLQTPPVHDNSLSPALHVSELGAPSQIEQISNTGLVQTAEVAWGRAP